MSERKTEQLNNLKTVFCKHEEGRGLLLSDPGQKWCTRENCHNTWHEYENPPVCYIAIEQHNED